MGAALTRVARWVALAWAAVALALIAGRVLPDRGTLAYVVAGENPHLILLDVYQMVRVRLDFDLDFAYAAVMSPDGERVAFALSDTIYITDLRDSQPIQHPTDETFPRLAGWTHDQSALIYHARRGVYALHPTTGESQRLHGARARFADVSPSGDALAYTTGSALLLLDFASGSYTTLHRTNDYNPVFSEPRFSADGNGLVYVADSWERDKRGIFFRDLQTGTEHRVSDRAFHVVSRPVLSVDGRYVAYQRTLRTGSEIYLADVQTGQHRLLDRVYFVTRLEWLP